MQFPCKVSFAKMPFVIEFPSFGLLRLRELDPEVSAETCDLIRTSKKPNENPLDMA